MFLDPIYQYNSNQKYQLRKQWEQLYGNLLLPMAELRFFYTPDQAHLLQEILDLFPDITYPEKRTDIYICLLNASLGLKLRGKKKIELKQRLSINEKVEIWTKSSSASGNFSTKAIAKAFKDKAALKELLKAVGYEDLSSPNVFATDKERVRIPVAYGGVSCTCEHAEIKVYAQCNPDEKQDWRSICFEGASAAQLNKVYLNLPDVVRDNDAFFFGGYPAFLDTIYTQGFA